VSGESVTSSVLTLFTSIIVQLFLSILIGLTCGLLNARLMKQFVFIRRFPIHQTSLVMLFGYLSYSIAEAVNVSGILTLFIAAVTLAHYSWHSLSKSSQVATRISFGAISDIAEGFAFSYVGLSLWYYTNELNFRFAGYLLVVVILSRVVTIYGLFFIFKFRFKTFDIPLSEQSGFIMGGIVRGCLCWAQILQVKGMNVLVTSTLIIVLSTTLGCGFLLPILMPLLGGDHKKSPYQSLAENEQQQQDAIYLSGADPKLPLHRFSPNANNSHISIPQHHPHHSALISSIEMTPLSEGGDANKENLYYQSQQNIRALNISIEDGVDGQCKYEQAEPNDSNKKQITLGNGLPSQSNAFASTTFFRQWIRFDEYVMKPIFGGSARDRLRLTILSEMDSPRSATSVSTSFPTGPPAHVQTALDTPSSTLLDCFSQVSFSKPPVHRATNFNSSNRGEILNADFNLSRDTCDADMDSDEHNLELLLSPEESLDLHFEDNGNIYHKPLHQYAANYNNSIANNFHTPHHTQLPPPISTYNRNNHHAITMNHSNINNNPKFKFDNKENGNRMGLVTPIKNRTPLSPEILSSYKKQSNDNSPYISPFGGNNNSPLLSKNLQQFS